MKYLMLIYGDEAAEAAMSEEELGAVFGAYGAFEGEVGPSGKRLGGEALQPTATATCVRVRGGETTVTDGPFAETKEQLGGFYLMECEDLDEALQWAAKIPGAAHGTVEVRPVLDVSALMDG